MVHHHCDLWVSRGLDHDLGNRHNRVIIPNCRGILLQVNHIYAPVTILLDSRASFPHQQLHPISFSLSLSRTSPRKCRRRPVNAAKSVTLSESGKCYSSGERKPAELRFTASPPMSPPDTWWFALVRVARGLSCARRTWTILFSRSFWLKPKKNTVSATRVR